MTSSRARLALSKQRPGSRGAPISFYSMHKNSFAKVLIIPDSFAFSALKSTYQTCRTLDFSKLTRSRSRRGSRRTNRPNGVIALLGTFDRRLQVNESRLSRFTFASLVCPSTLTSYLYTRGARLCGRATGGICTHTCVHAHRCNSGALAVASHRLFLSLCASSPRPREYAPNYKYSRYQCTREEHEYVNRFLQSRSNRFYCRFRPRPAGRRRRRRLFNNRTDVISPT